MSENEPPPTPDFSRGLPHAGTDGLLPVIAQDANTGEVLMMAWADRQAFDETQATRWATYYSRSRGRLWRKGESSGHRQRVVEIRVDCDGDCILLRVEQTGAACHDGFRRCFYRRIDQDGGVSITDQRRIDPATVYDDPSR